MKSITESKVERIKDEIIASPLDGRDSFIVNDNDTVSMNFLLFTPSIFKYIEDGFSNFFESNKNDLLSSEYLIPDVVSNLINEGKVSMKVIKTSSNWHGVTYKEDTPDVKNAIRKLVDKGEYNINLWS